MATPKELNNEEIQEQPITQTPLKTLSGTERGEFYVNRVQGLTILQSATDSDLLIDSGPHASIILNGRTLSMDQLDYGIASDVVFEALSVERRVGFESGTITTSGSGNPSTIPSFTLGKSEITVTDGGVSSIYGISGRLNLGKIEWYAPTTQFINQIDVELRGADFTTAEESPVFTGGNVILRGGCGATNGRVGIKKPYPGEPIAFLDASLISDDRIVSFPDSAGTFALQSSVSTTFTTSDDPRQVITVVNGIITSIA